MAEQLGPKAHALADRIADRAADRAVKMLSASIVGRLSQLEADLGELYELTAIQGRRAPTPAPVRDELRLFVVRALTVDPQWPVEVERAIGRPRRDRSTRRTLVELAVAGIAERDELGRYSLAIDDGRCPACRRPWDG